MKDPYKTLGVAHTANDEEIQKAYKQLVKKYHPDLHPNDAHAAKMMADVNEAYDAITKNTREAQYYRSGGTEEGAARARQQQQQQSPYNGYGWPFGGYDTGSSSTGGSGSGNRTGNTDSNGNPYYGDYDPFDNFDPFEWFNTSSTQQTGQHQQQHQRQSTVFFPGGSCLGWIIAMVILNAVFAILLNGCQSIFYGFGRL